MPLIEEKDQEAIRNFFADLPHAVKLVVFTQENECMYCKETRQMAEEIAALSEHVTAEVYDFVADSDEVQKYNIDKIPAIAVVGAKDYGVRYYGIPAGYEFTSLIEDIIDVAKGNSGLSPNSREEIAIIKKKVHIQVFVTPTCPYCPAAVRLAHKAAIENDYIVADMVESSEFPHLANKYEVKGVPRTVINERTFLEGAAPEPLFVKKLVEAIQKVW